MTFDEWFKLNKDMLKSAYDAGFKEGLKQEKPLPIPTPPYVKYPTRDHETTWPNIKSCSKCGINLTGVMGYVCYDMQCPTQMRITAGGGSTLSGVAHSGSVGARGSYGYSEGVGMGDIKK